jgi:hypothetical protein
MVSAMKLYRTILLVQGVYYLITAIWPLIDINSFMVVTGYKTDQWLVKTVGALLIPIALTLLSLRYLKADFRIGLILGSTSALAFIIIDFYYSVRNSIKDIYQIDGLAEILILLAWLYLAVFRGKEVNR